MNITILGHVCIDNNKSKGTAYVTAGSPAMFVARVCNRFPQVQTHIIAPYGSDFSRYTSNVSIYPQKPLGDKTLLYENNSQGNLRTQRALNRESARPIPIDEEVVTRIHASDIVFFAPLTPIYEVEYVKKCLSFTPKKALKIILPQGYYRDFTSDNEVIQRMFVEADELISLFDFVIVSEQDHQEMLSITHKWAQKIRVVMTMGDEGAMYLDSTHSFIVRTIPVPDEKIINSVGLGDIFSASFGYKYYLTKNIYASLEFANVIARQCLFFKPDKLQFTLPK